MAKLVLKDVNVVFNGTDISSNVASVSLVSSAAEVPTTAFGTTAITRVSGLIDNSVTFSIHNDYNAIDGIFFPLVGSTAVTCVIRPNGTAPGTATATNPTYTFSVIVTEWQAVNGAVGELATADVTFPISGAITKAITGS
jgi:hypothetical protein